MPRYSLNELIETWTGILGVKGLPEDRARRIATAQVELHAFGVTTHGLPVLNYLSNVIGEHVSPEKKPSVERDSGCICVLRCKNCISVESLLDGRDLALERAAQHGLGLVSLLENGWVGALGFHLARAAWAGYLAMGWAQMSGQPDSPPFGGREGRLSTNPMALVMPAEPWPIVADFSTTAISRGKSSQLISGGKRAPEPLYLDAEGKATDDPKVLKEGGTILPFGGRHFGFRGTALSLWIEALTAAAGGLPANAQKKGGQNVHLLAIDISAMSSLDHYRDSMSEMLPYVYSSKPVEGREGPRVPGHLEWRALEIARREGLMLDEYNASEMRKRVDEHGIKMPAER